MTVEPLTDSERARFTAYLAQNAKDNDSMATQLAKMGTLHEEKVKQLRLHAAAQTIVARELRRTETVTMDANINAGNHSTA